MVRITLNPDLKKYIAYITILHILLISFRRTKMPGPRHLNLLKRNCLPMFKSMLKINSKATVQHLFIRFAYVWTRFQMLYTRSSAINMSRRHTWRRVAPNSSQIANKSIRCIIIYKNIVNHFRNFISHRTTSYRPNCKCFACFFLTVLCFLCFNVRLIWYKMDIINLFG